MHDTDAAWMERALSLARATVGLSSPNPQVGCVLVRDSRVLGEGAHRYEQRDHAEIVALKQAAAAGHDVHGATAYVTLEPCSHHGRTGPCADALISAGVARVVVATVDPNPQVSSRGVGKLRAAGVTVEVGVGQTAARRMNDTFALSITQRRPFVTLKAALSVDGHLAPSPCARKRGEPFWLTGPESRAEVHRMRHGSDAILTGVGTVRADDPLLTDRSGLPRRRPLLRVVMTTSLTSLPLTARVLETAAAGDVCIFCSTRTQLTTPNRFAAVAAMGARLEAIGPDHYPARDAAGVLIPSRLDPAEVLKRLYEQSQITSVLLEGGSYINGAFLAAGLVDRAVLFYSEKELGADAVPFAATATARISPFALEQQMLAVERRSFGADVMVAGNLRDPWAGVASAQPTSE